MNDTGISGQKTCKKDLLQSKIESEQHNGNLLRMLTDEHKVTCECVRLAPRERALPSRAMDLASKKSNENCCRAQALAWSRISLGVHLEGREMHLI